MSARDALLAYLRQSGLSTPRAEANLDAFAHELAERQRAWAESFGETPTQQAIRSVISEAADLIDPKKKEQPS